MYNKPDLERFSLIEKLFFETIEQPTDHRKSFLIKACAGDEILQKEVAKLLEADGDTNGLINAAPWSTNHSTTDIISDIHDHVTETKTIIGPYSLQRLISRGGMGEVWFAQRNDGQFQQDVAIKLIRRGMDSEDILARFRRERQVLAALNHPNVAQLLDGGATTDHRPYLVMEYVEGIPIDQYCHEKKLAVHQRLDLILKVCQAVQYAHANLVVHRDLKPSNILVTDEGVPKLLDFGIAKVLQADASPHAMTITATGERLLTPRYASPEQVRGQFVSIASDVYSLGVLIYELLTGRLPYGEDTVSRHEIERAIIETKPKKPSDIVTSSGQRTVTETYSQSMNPRHIRRSLRGDLDTIILNALAKEPDTRYASVEGLAEDIHRHIEGIPLFASQPGIITRGVRYLRRHRGALTAASIGGIASLIVAIVFVIYWFIVPIWVEQHLQKAHLILGGQHTNHGIYNVIFWNTADIRSRSFINTIDQEVLEKALEHYDIAARLAPRNNILSLERKVVELAIALISQSNQAVDICGAIDGDINLTHAYALNWYNNNTVTRFDEEILDSASEDDLRCLGLLGLIMGDPEISIDTWSRLRLMSADPLIEASLGNMYLALNEPELAYPRLQSAHRAMPGSGTLMIYLADAAVRCGDVAQASLLLDRAKDNYSADRAQALERVSMLCLLAQGKTADAVVLYEQCNLELSNPVAAVQLAGYFEKQGKYRRALDILAGRLDTGAIEQITPMKFTQLMEVWWDNLSVDERQKLIDDPHEMNHSDSHSFMDLLKLYVTVHNKSQHPQPHPLAERAQWINQKHSVNETQLATIRKVLITIAEQLMGSDR